MHLCTQHFYVNFRIKLQLVQFSHWCFTELYCYEIVLRIAKPPSTLSLYGSLNNLPRGYNYQFLFSVFATYSMYR